MRSLLLCCVALTGFATLATGAADGVRVAVLLPFVETALEAAPGRSVLVASVRQELARAPAGDLVDLGNPHAPSLERLAEARPGLVVADSLLHARLAPQLARSGAEVVLLDTTSIDATFAGLVELGARVGSEPAMRARVDAARREIDALALAEPLPVLALFGTPGSLLVVTEAAWLGDLLRALRFENVGASVVGTARMPGYVQISDEQMVQLRPALILLVSHGDPAAIEAAFRERLASGGAWGGMAGAAVKGVHAVEPDLFAANPGLALPQAARRLVALAATSGAPDGS